jgi:hypothetical protein
MAKQPFSYWFRIRARARAGERGASAVEFALIAPLFFMIVFGMFSGGLLYNERSQMTFASREATRYGSTLPVGQKFSGAINADAIGGCVVNSVGTVDGRLWACNVARAAITAAGGDLGTAVPNRYVCVAVIKENTVNTVLTDGANNYNYSVGTAPVPAPGPTCFNDLGADMNRRVHVVVRRNGTLNAILFNWTIPINSSGVGRSEIPPS